MAKHPKQSRGAQRRGREDRLGQAGAAGRLPRPRRTWAFDSYVAAAAEVSVTAATRSRSTASSRRPIRPRRQSGADRPAGRRLVRLRPVGAVPGRNARSRTAASCETNFDTYDSMRIAQMPKVESIIMPTGGDGPWGGVGEPTICVAAPAVLNAYLHGDGQAHPLVPAEEPQPRDRVYATERRPARPPLRFWLDCGTEST